MKSFLKFSGVAMLVAALVTLSFAFTAKPEATKAVKFAVEYRTYSTTAVQPPTVASTNTTSGNWSASLSSLPAYTPGSNLYAIEYNGITFAQAVAVLQANLPNFASFTDGQTLTSGSNSIKVHLIL